MRAKYCFIVGTGRSGTNFLNTVVVEHPDVDDLHSGKENRHVLMRSTKAALMNKTKLPVLNLLYYKYAKSRLGQKVFLDQSHPNLHLVTDTEVKLKGAHFVVLWRSTNAVVASMLKHEGVRRWQQEAEKFP